VSFGASYEKEFPEDADMKAPREFITLSEAFLTGLDQRPNGINLALIT